jgi:hypothetical protein
MQGSGTRKTAVWHWQERFMTEGVTGLLQGKTRPSRIPPLARRRGKGCKGDAAQPRPGRDDAPDGTCGCD